ncbi:hypothetical protein Tco_0603167 [Tanacetum coccineum]
MNRLKLNNLTQDVLTGPTYDLMKGTCKSVVELEYHLEEVFKATNDQLDWHNLEGRPYPYDLSKPLPLIQNARGRQVIPFDHFINNDLEYLKGGSLSQKYTTSLTKMKAADYGTYHWGPKHQRFYGYATNMETSKDVYSRHKIIVVTSLKIMEFFGYKHLEEIIVRRQDDQLYRFREGDFKRLRRQDIEDMLLLLVQGKLTNLNLDERFALNVALRMYTRRIVIQERVEDLQLAVESYQKKINLSRPDSYRSDLRKITPYTSYHDIQGIIYQDDMDRNRLMHTHELHMFSNGTLNHVRTALNDIATRIQMEYLPKRKWSKQDRQRARVMINAIDKKLRDRSSRKAYDLKEDINQKFLRSLPPLWSQIALIMRNKPDIDEIDIDDLYNNLRVYEDEMKKSSNSSSKYSENLAFFPLRILTLLIDIALLLSCTTNNRPQLENEGFLAVDGDDLENCIFVAGAMLTCSESGRSQGRRPYSDNGRSNAQTTESSSQALVAQDGGFVAFGSDPKGGKITGKGKIKTANLDFDDVYFVDELKFNLFSVSQMCDKKNSVLFNESECLILSPSFKLLDESQVFLELLEKMMCTQDSYVAGSSGEDKGPIQEYILLPLQPHRTRIPVKDVVQDAQEQPSKNAITERVIQDSEDVFDKEGQHQMPEDEQVWQDELEMMVTQELVANAMNDESRQAFEEEKRRIASQKKAAQATSTNQLSTDRPFVSTGRSFVSTDRSNTPNVSAASTSTGANADESSFPDLEISDTLPNDGIFNGAYDDDEDVGAVADFNNMDNTIAVSPIPTLRIHKDHPKGQILGDPTSAVQTRGKIQKASSAQQALVKEPKTISQALKDESWVEAMQEELLQFKLQQVWILVDLPLERRQFALIGFIMKQEDKRSLVIKEKSCFSYGTTIKLLELGKETTSLLFLMENVIRRGQTSCLLSMPVQGFKSLQKAPITCSKRRSMDLRMDKCSPGKYYSSMVYYISTGRQILILVDGRWCWYALTHNPTIYDSLVKQFWQTATVRTLANGTQQLVASIDSKEYTITEASVRSKLQLADAT